MIPRKKRLSLAEFPKKSAPATHLGLFGLKTRPNGLGYNRFAVIVSSKQESRAAGRHLIRRRIAGRAVKLPERGLDMLFIAARPAVEYRKRELDRIFARLAK